MPCYQFNDKSQSQSQAVEDAMQLARKVFVHFPEAKIENAWYDDRDRLFVNVDRIVKDFSEHLVPDFQLRPRRYGNKNDKVMSIRQALSWHLSSNFETGELERMKVEHDRLVEVVADLLETLASRRVLDSDEVIEILDGGFEACSAQEQHPPARKRGHKVEG